VTVEELMVRTPPRPMPRVLEHRAGKLSRRAKAPAGQGVKGKISPPTCPSVAVYPPTGTTPMGTLRTSRNGNVSTFWIVGKLLEAHLAAPQTCDRKTASKNFFRNVARQVTGFFLLRC